MIHFFPDSQATNQSTTRYPILGIEFSESCSKILQYNINSSCPQLSQLTKYDTSNQKVSGQFILYHGKIIRTNPEFKNHWLYYTNETVCVYCDLDLAQPDLFKTIFIEPSSFTFINKADNSTNYKYISYSERYVSEDCSTATIAYSDKLLNDTISYMLSNCTKTNIQTNQTNTLKEIPFSYDNPFSSLLLKNYLNEIMHGHNYFEGNHTQGGLGPENCITHKCNFTDIYKKPGW